MPNQETTTCSDVPVVFIHGLWGVSSIDYAHLDGEALGRRLVLIDLPGSGRPLDESCDITIEGLSRHVADELVATGVSRAVMVGHSMGGAVVMSLAALHPQMVAGVILTESNLDPGGGVWSRRIAAMSESKFVSEGYRNLIVHQQVEAPTWARTVALSSPVALHREAVSLVAGTRPTWRETLYELDCPRFYVFGDRTLPDPDAEELPCHGVEVVVIPDAGHNMVHDNLSGFAQMLSDCLRQVP